MNDGVVQIAPPSTGPKMDVTEKLVGGQTVERQRVALGGNLSDNFAEPTPEGRLPICDDDAQTMIALLAQIANGLDIDPMSGRRRVLLDAISGALTLATVTTVGTVSAVSALNAIGPFSASGVVLDLQNLNWSNNYLPCVSN